MQVKAERKLKYIDRAYSNEGLINVVAKVLRVEETLKNPKMLEVPLIVVLQALVAQK